MKSVIFVFLHLNFHSSEIVSHPHLSAVRPLPQLSQPIRLMASAADPSFAELTLAVSQSVGQLHTDTHSTRCTS